MLYEDAISFFRSKEKDLTYQLELVRHSIVLLQSENPIPLQTRTSKSKVKVKVQRKVQRKVRVKSKVISNIVPIKKLRNFVVRSAARVSQITRQQLHERANKKFDLKTPSAKHKLDLAVIDLIQHGKLTRIGKGIYQKPTTRNEATETIAV